MEQLKVKDIINTIERLRKKGMKFDKIMELPVFIGDDDELNGIHCAWYCETLNKKDEDDQGVIDLIEMRGLDFDEDVGVLIS